VPADRLNRAVEVSEERAPRVPATMTCVEAETAGAQMPEEAGRASGNAPRWFRGVKTRDGALTSGVLYLLFAVAFGAMASGQTGVPRWLWAAVCLGFLLLSFGYWIAARRIGKDRSGTGIAR
jgi:hypothetical protein